MSSIITKLSRLKKGLSQDVEDNTDNIQHNTCSAENCLNTLLCCMCKHSVGSNYHFVIVLSIFDIHRHQKLM